jgi:hypothetical protein
VNRVYEEISGVNLHSEGSAEFKGWLEKDGDKLFMFLTFDGVPWNSNNAEHAVKPFAALRRIVWGITTEKGIRDYLVLLSICQTFWISSVRARRTFKPSQRVAAGACCGRKPANPAACRQIQPPVLIASSDRHRVESPRQMELSDFKRPFARLRGGAKKP